MTVNDSVKIEDPRHRSRERYRRGAGGVVSALVGRSVSLAVSIVTIPITLPYLGLERFGIWMTINSLVALASFADLGMGLALMNAVAAAHGRGDTQGQRASFTNAIAISLVIACVLGALFLGAQGLVDWQRLLNISSAGATGEVRTSVLVIMAVFLVGLPLGLANSVWNGLQRTYVPNLSVALGAGVALLGVIFSVKLGFGIPALVAAVSGGPLFASAVTFALLRAFRTDIRPRIALLSKPEAARLVGAGMSFFMLQLALAVATSSDPLVLTRVIGPQAVAQYWVVSRLYAVPFGISVALISVSWPAFREAGSRGDHAWVLRAFKLVVGASVAIVIPFSIAAVFIGPAVVSFITAGRIALDASLFVAFGASTLAWTLANSLSVLLSSRAVVWPQVLSWGLMAVANISLGVALASRIGTSGVVWANAITFGAMVVPLVLLAKRNAVFSAV
jgi:O-antigen/teichoic acid export membrane protein